MNCDCSELYKDEQGDITFSITNNSVKETKPYINTQKRVGKHEDTNKTAKGRQRKILTLMWRGAHTVLYGLKYNYQNIVNSLLLNGEQMGEKDLAQQVSSATTILQKCERDPKLRESEVANEKWRGDDSRDSNRR